MQTRIWWTAPQSRTDGTALSQEEIDALVYDLGYQTVDGLEDYTVIAVLPSTLNSEGNYQVMIADLNLPDEDIAVAIRATDREGRMSAWSHEVLVYKGPAPNPPAALGAD